MVERTACDPDGLARIRAARAHARAWRAGGSPDPEAVIVIDLDGTLVCSHGSCGGASESVDTQARLARVWAHHRKFH